jgi:hypothetical protein
MIKVSLENKLYFKCIIKDNFKILFKKKINFFFKNIFLINIVSYSSLIVNSLIVKLFISTSRSFSFKFFFELRTLNN